MTRRIIGVFMYSAGLLLLFTALGKLISSTGQEGALAALEPISQMPFRYVFIIVGVAEICVGLTCFFGKGLLSRAMIVAWFATCLALYRIGLMWIGYHGPCGCLGSLTEMISISPGKADVIMRIALGYLLAGSYGSIFALHKQALQAQPSELGFQIIGGE